MTSTSVFAAILVSLLYVESAIAQSVDEKKAAAEKWLARNEIKINYVGPYTATFSVDTKAKTVLFYNSPDRFCASGPVPTDTAINQDGFLVFTFDSKRNGCLQIQYTFDPITKAGTVRGRPTGSAPDFPWNDSKSKVSLVE